MKQLSKIIFLLACFYFINAPSKAAVYTWIGPNNGSFSDPANFSPNRTAPLGTDTIIITGGLGGDTIIAPASYAPSFFYYWEIGTLRIANGKQITFNGKVINNSSTFFSSLKINGVQGKTLQIDSNCTLNIYGNGYEISGNNYSSFTVGDHRYTTEARIDGRLTINTILAPGSHPAAIQRAVGLLFQGCKVTINGIIEIKSDSLNLSSALNSLSFIPTFDNQPSKVILNGDFIFTGGRQTTNFNDSILQVEPTGRVILNFPANATMHNLKGVYKPGSQVIINGHPGSDTALITLPDSIHHLIVNTNGNARPLHLVARSNINDSLVPILIKGNVTINKTGTSSIEFNTATNNKTATVLGNLTLNGGDLQIRNYGNLVTDTGSRVFIKGNYLQNGGTLNFIGTHPKVGQLLVKGNFFQYNGLIKNTSGSLFPQIVLNGTDTQRLRLRSNIDDSITFVFNNPAGFILDSNLVLGAGSSVEYINGSISGSGSVVYASPSSVLLFSNPSPANPSNNLWSASQVPYQVVLQNTAALTLTGSKQIRNNLTIGKGWLNIAPTDSLVIGSVSQMAIVNQTGDGFVQGKLSLWIGAQTGTYKFPLGLNGNSKTIELQYTNSPNTSGTLSATYSNLLPGNLGLPLKQGSDSILNTVGNGFWTINAGNGLTGGTYSIKAFSNTVSGVSDIQNIRLLKRSNSSAAWLAPGAHGTSVGRTDSFYVTRTGLVGFSDFALAQKLASLNIGNNNIGSNQTICEGRIPSTLLGSMPSNGTGNYTYLWLYATSGISGNYSPALGINTNQNYSPIAVLGAVWYKRVVFSGASVDTSNAVLVQTEPKLKVGFTVNKQIQCLNGNQFIFTDTTQGNKNRLWVYGLGQTDTSAVLTLSYNAGPNNSHQISLLGSANGSCVDTAFKTVYLNTNPITSAISGDTMVKLSNIKKYEVIGRAGSSYSWFFTKGKGNSTSNSIQIQWTSIGKDLLKVLETNNSSCTGDTILLEVNVSQLIGLPIDLERENVLVYPNPSNGNFKVESKEFEIEQIHVLNLFGQVLMSETTTTDKRDLKVDLSQLPVGVYLLQLDLENKQRQMHKISIQHP